MSKIYSKNVIKHIQNLLNTGDIQITSFTDYKDILPGNRITYGKIRVGFVPTQHPKIKGYTANATYHEEVTKEYRKAWKNLPVGSHLINDFKHLNLDQNNNVPYKEIIFKDESGNDMKALIRHMYEIDEMDADNPECQEYYETYTDLIHLNQCFMIIKITDLDNYGYCAADKFKIDGGNTIYEPFSSFTPIPEDDSMPAETSIPLFD